MGIAVCASCKRRPAAAERDTSVLARKPSSTPGARSTLRDGDLVFQESTSGQSEMVRVLTGSRWTHMGVVFQEPAGPIVLEAVSPVRKTPLERWIDRGRRRHYVVKRLR